MMVLKLLQNQLRTILEPTTSYAGQNVIVVGATGGLGLEAARHFARLGAARVILACRSTERGEVAKADIEKSVTTSTVVEVWPLDLCSFDSVRAFCKRADKELERLDVLLASAAMLTVFTVQMAEGYEMMVTTNVISTYLTAVMLLPLMKRTAAKFNVQPIVTTVGSDGHLFAKFVEKDAPHIFESFRPGDNMTDRYSVTKLLDIMLAQELAERLDAAHAGASPVVVNAANPGLCKSDLFRDIPLVGKIFVGVLSLLIGRTNEGGSRALMAAVAGGRESHGKYVNSGKVDDPSAFVRSEEGQAVRNKVWKELMEIFEGIEPGVTANVTGTPA